MQYITAQDKAAAPAASAAASVLTVETVNNHVYFYSGVNTDRTLALVKAIRELDASLRNERITRAIPDDYPQTPIWLHVQSYGGDLHAGLGIADQLRGFETPLYSVVEGACCSAATLISMACTKRYILPRSFMLIHQFSSLAWGTYEQLKDELALQDMMMAQLTDFYVQRSKLTAKRVKEMLQHDTWCSAQQALEYGLVDEIVT